MCYLYNSIICIDVNYDQWWFYISVNYIIVKINFLLFTCLLKSI